MEAIQEGLWTWRYASVCSSSTRSRALYLTHSDNNNNDDDTDEEEEEEKKAMHAMVIKILLSFPTFY